MYSKFLKRLIDLALSIILLILLSPIILLAMLTLAIANKGNPFFFQKRPGRNEQIFRIIKFKTMNDRRDGNSKLLPDKIRLTPVGKFIRKTSIDELPQLFNVLIGQMSLIGPRPLLIEYLPLYNSQQYRRHEVRPGITGWAQVNGRNAITWEQKFELDVWYVDHLSFTLDLKILFMTLIKVIRSQGINARGQATTKRFEGSKRINIQ